MQKRKKLSKTKDHKLAKLHNIIKAEKKNNN